MGVGGGDRALLPLELTLLAETTETLLLGAAALLPPLLLDDDVTSEEVSPLFAEIHSADPTAVRVDQKGQKKKRKITCWPLWRRGDGVRSLWEWST